MSVLQNQNFHLNELLSLQNQDWNFDNVFMRVQTTVHVSIYVSGEQNFHNVNNRISVINAVSTSSVAANMQYKMTIDIHLLLRLCLRQQGECKRILQHYNILSNTNL